ncbi:MAG TPA: hypothetical protein RMF84_10760 [Polyangiaceae bacterium LLY-WYZ-14_1]|nr:hypothetical protein [Polyangiaceae bacterium LLY-WYZ-14_1]
MEVDLVVIAHPGPETASPGTRRTGRVAAPALVVPTPVDGFGVAPPSATTRPRFLSWGVGVAGVDVVRHGGKEELARRVGAAR